MKSFLNIFKLCSDLNNLFYNTLIAASLIGLFAIASYFNFVGCKVKSDDVKPDGDGFTPDPQAYLVSSTDVIKAEYPTYLLVQSSDYKEERPIFIGGTLGANPNLTDYGKIWWTYGMSDTGGYSSFGNYADSYLEESTGKYTAQVLLNPSEKFSLGALATFTVNIGNGTGIGIKSSALFNVRIISERKYPIKYSYQSGLDVFNDNISYECDYRLKKAFADANTFLNLTDEKAGTLSQETIQYYDPQNPTKDAGGIIKYVETNIIDDPNDNIKFRLIIAYDLSSDAPFNYGGLTIRSVPWSTGFSFVFYNKINSQTSFSQEKRKKLITFAIIHELGHLRGQDQDITDKTTHSTGHNGINKSQCIMLDGTDPNLDNILANLVFCSGHQQFLLNRE